MLPQLPTALDPEFASEFAETSNGAGSCSLPDSVDHHCQICPTCGQRLEGYRCKLVCLRCGYYLSCADYY